VSAPRCKHCGAFGATHERWCFTRSLFFYPTPEGLKREAPGDGLRDGIFLGRDRAPPMVPALGRADDPSPERLEAETRLADLRKSLVSRHQAIVTAMNAGAIVGALLALSYLLFERVFG
jgi:hypothetical protein